MNATSWTARPTAVPLENPSYSIDQLREELLSQAEELIEMSIITVEARKEWCGSIDHPTREWLDEAKAWMRVLARLRVRECVERT